MTKNENNYNELKEFACNWGADLFGVADISGIKDKFKLSKGILEKIDKAVSIGVGLSRAILEEIKDHPTKLYFHHYKTVNMFLDQLNIRITKFIQRRGYNAAPIPASQIVDWEKQTGHLSHREVAQLAGLGWIGRNNLLVNKKLGSQLRLATLLTDMPMKTDSPLKESCGECRACIEMCPAGAIGERKEDYSFSKCLEKLKDFRKQRYVDQFICGVCVKACSGNKSLTRP